MEPAEGLDKGCRGETSHTLETGEKAPKHTEQDCGRVLRTAKSKHTSLSHNKVTGDVFAFLALCADLFARRTAHWFGPGCGTISPRLSKHRWPRAPSLTTAVVGLFQSATRRVNRPTTTNRNNNSCQDTFPALPGYPWARYPTPNAHMGPGDEPATLPSLFAPSQPTLGIGPPLIPPQEPTGEKRLEDGWNHNGEKSRKKNALLTSRAE